MADLTLHEKVETLLGEAHLEVRRFMAAHYARVDSPVYASSDVRNAGWKTVSVDTNAFPAGFNNLCPGNRRGAVAALRTYFAAHHPDVGKVLLLPEDHTRNPFYLQNVHYLSTILNEAGIAHGIGSADPEVVHGVRGMTTPEGFTLEYELVTRRDGGLRVGTEPVDMVLSNNDFTTGLPRPLQDTTVPIIPLPELGWHHRSKAKHFALYNHLVEQLSARIGLDPWHLSVDTRLVRNVDFKKREGLEPLAATVEDLLSTMQARYDTLGIDETPRVFIKDDAGTYGMGITVANSGDDVRALNNRQRQKMDKGKYGHKVDRVIVQEGVPTIEQVEGSVAEPVFYSIGGKPIGAFMRLHPDKGAGDNLNQPGMRFLPVCRHRGCHEEGREMLDFCATNAEQVVAELAALALAYESTEAVRRAADATQVTLPEMVAV